MESARETAENFNELAKDVEVFPRKVAAALKVKAESAGIFESMWNWLTRYVFLFSYSSSTANASRVSSSGCA